MTDLEQGKPPPYREAHPPVEIFPSSGLAKGSEILLLPPHARFCRCTPCRSRRSQQLVAATSTGADRTLVMAVLLLALVVLVGALVGGPLLR